VECLNKKGCKFKREPRRAHVLSLNKELIRTCYTQTRTLKARAAKMPGEAKKASAAA